jgi:aminopeptidase-like protein
VVEPDDIGNELYSLIEELYPIARSITGDGLRRSLAILGKHAALEIHEVPSGTKVFDWTVPKEWNIRDAYVKDPRGNKIIDFQKCNLHVVSYSTPVHEIVPLEDLRPRLFTLADRPDWIPYRTSYYEESWGFCMRHSDYLALERGDYEVFIDSTLEDGSLTYGELYLPGEERSEVLISSHTCHPSMCNDNLSGVVIAALLARELSKQTHRCSYRFLFVPGTIGAITWLALNDDKTGNIDHGLVLSGLGDRGGFTYKKSRRGTADIDRVVSHCLKRSGSAHAIVEFDPFGGDERQYCSPGFDLAVGNLSRTPWGTYPEYHTSADDLTFVTPGSLGDSFNLVRDILETLDANRRYVNLNPKCEPQLGRRGLYPSEAQAQRATMWVLNLSDGVRDLLDISEKSGVDFKLVAGIAQRFVSAGLLAPATS